MYPFFSRNFDGRRGWRQTWFARQPCKQATSYEQVCHIKDALQDGGRFGISQEGVQDITERAAFGKNMGGIPHRCCRNGQPAELLHILNGIAKQSGGKKQE